MRIAKNHCGQRHYWQFLFFQHIRFVIEPSDG
jgi:hypothetical protein